MTVDGALVEAGSKPRLSTVAAARGEQSAVRWARPIVLARSMSVSVALATAADEGLKQLGANEAAARLGADIEGVHQMRVGLRRLKVVLSLAI